MLLLWQGSIDMERNPCSSHQGFYIISTGGVRTTPIAIDAVELQCTTSPYRLYFASQAKICKHPSQQLHTCAERWHYQNETQIYIQHSAFTPQWAVFPMKFLAASPAGLSFLVACVRSYVQRPYTASKCAKVRSRKKTGKLNVMRCLIRRGHWKLHLLFQFSLVTDKKTASKMLCPKRPAQCTL